MGRPQTPDPADAGTRRTPDGSDPGRSDLPGGDPRYRFTAPISVSREDIAERIAEHVADRIEWQHAIDYTNEPFTELFVAEPIRPIHDDDTGATYTETYRLAGSVNGTHYAAVNPLTGTTSNATFDGAPYALSEPMHPSRQTPRRRPVSVASSTGQQVAR